jgi:cell division protease FtsH
MNDENKSKLDAKKPFPKGFFFILLLSILVIATVQNFTNTRQATVTNSYQLESLVDLDLLLPKDSKKIALNDNLVSFSGKFREKVTKEGEERYKFLQLLNTQYNLNIEKINLDTELNLLQERIREAALWFLNISGIPIPREGYVVIEELYDTPERKNSVVIENLPNRSANNLQDLEQRFIALKENPQTEQITAFGIALEKLTSAFLSSNLGIGKENIKQALRKIDQEVTHSRKNTSLPAAQRLSSYQISLRKLATIVNEMNQVKDHMRFVQLRSVRDYSESLDKYKHLTSSLSDNQVQLEKARLAVSHVIWFFNNEELSTRALEKLDIELFGNWFVTAKEEWTNFSQNRGLTFKVPDQPRNLVLDKTFKSEEPAPNYLSYLFTILPIVLIGLLLYFVFFRQMKGMGNNAMNFGKSPAKMLNKENVKVTFLDVAGIDEAKEELEEIVEFLKSPGKFTALGGRIPKGVLCVGPPGTGKTLIAKAVAGEADRPFFSISGSDFVEMFVGVGASRIRDMFEQAKKHSPSIVFIDEIDAVGRHRGAGIGGGHDEREQTLNQLLVEMDGFGDNDGVILMAATNRPDVLDKALLRPGRFDRRIVIDLPDIKGRYEILKVHAKKIKLDTTVDLMIIARMTPGSSGADLANLLNEAALIAAKKDRTAVTSQDTVEACDKVRFGKERKSLEIDCKEKETTAYHESGHAVVALVVEHADPVEKVTIIPRGFSLGATHFVPKKNRLGYWKNEVIDQLAVLMGGRVAEEIFVNDISSGAQQDIKQATALARSMICEWGMSDLLGNVAYEQQGNSGQYLGLSQTQRSYSEETAKNIDAEVRKLIDTAYKRAKTIITKNKKALQLMTEMLVEFETLDSIDVNTIIEGTWNIEEKRERLEKAIKMHAKPVTPPPPPSLEKNGEEEHPPTEGLNPQPSI